MESHEDPGWTGAWKGAAPYYATIAKERGKGGLALLRLAFITIVANALVPGVVLPFLGLKAGDGKDATVGILIVVGVGIVSSAAGLVLLKKLDRSSLESLGRTYRRQFFLRLVLAELPALVGFVLAFLVGSPLTYAVALPFVAFGLVRVAPTAAKIDRDQDELNANGCALSLRDALETPAER